MSRLLQEMSEEEEAAGDCVQNVGAGKDSHRRNAPWSTEVLSAGPGGSVVGFIEDGRGKVDPGLGDCTS